MSDLSGCCQFSTFRKNQSYTAFSDCTSFSKCYFLDDALATLPTTIWHIGEVADFPDSHPYKVPAVKVRKISIQRTFPAISRICVLSAGLLFGDYLSRFAFPLRQPLSSIKARSPHNNEQPTVQLLSQKAPRHF